jgi:hypothetical protein
MLYTSELLALNVTAGLEPATCALEERRSRPSELRHRKAAEPGFGPGISRFKAEYVSNYTTPQKSQWLGTELNRQHLPLQCSALPG